MAPPTTAGRSLLGTKTVVAFLVGIGAGFAVTAPVLPDSTGDFVATVLAGGGDVILAGVVALAILMVVLEMFYILYL